jgi:hypothetical protein
VLAVHAKRDNTTRVGLPFASGIVTRVRAPLGSSDIGRIKGVGSLVITVVGAATDKAVAPRRYACGVQWVARRVRAAVGGGGCSLLVAAAIEAAEIAETEVRRNITINNVHIKVYEMGLT